MRGSTSSTSVSGFIASNNPIYTNLEGVAASPDNKNTDLETIVHNYASTANFTLGIGIKNLDTGEEYYLNKALPFESASLYKLVVMYGVFYEGRNGKLNVNDPEIQSQLDSMITVSSNEAAITLSEKIGWDRLDDIAKNIGLKNTSLYSPITTTPEDITNLLNLIVTGRALDPSNSARMKELLLKQKINDRIPLLLPSGVPVAHKTGELDDVRHDAGIVYGPKSTYIITLMSKDIKSETETKDLMARLSLDIYNHFQK